MLTRVTDDPWIDAFRDFEAGVCLAHQPPPPSIAHSYPACTTGELGGDVFILVRGELHVLDSDGSTCIFRIGEGTVFGESTVLRHMEVREMESRAAGSWSVCCWKPRQRYDIGGHVRLVSPTNDLGCVTSTHRLSHISHT